MPQSDFQFKQFAINHDKCAMKVNTDGIVLGAWANVESATRILDIGTGSGLIALMLAQRTQAQQATITAVELDSAAAEQAAENFLSSQWSTRLHVERADIIDWSQQTTQQFDLIVSNPPYFSNSLKAKNKSRTQARHNQQLSFQALLMSAKRVSNQNTKLALILPCDEMRRLYDLAATTGWYLTHQTLVRTVVDKQLTRTLACFERQVATVIIENELTIRDKQNQYTEQFTALCREFYLKMV